MFEYILIAHSDIETRSILYEVLTNLGYKVTTVFSYKELVDALKKIRPNYIILDSSLSDISNEAVLEKIKIIDENIKVIVLPSNKDKFQLTQDILKLLREQKNIFSTHQETKETYIKANILVIDDEIECARLTKNYLAKRGYNVEMASTGEEAILKIKAHKPDIVFLDIHLPGADGIIVLKTIKEIDKSIIVIMTSAIEDERVVQEAIKDGADGYLIKPFNIPNLEIMMLSKIKVSQSYQPYLF